MGVGTNPVRPIFISTVQFDRQIAAGQAAVLDLAPVAARFGVQGVEYRDVHWKEKAVELPAVRRQLAEFRLQAAYTTVMPLYAADPAHHQQLLRDLDDAKALGAILLRVNLGERASDRPEGAAAVDALARKAVARAEAMGMTLSIENNSQPPGHGIGDIEAALRALQSGHVGTNIDFANYVTTDQDPVAAIRTLGRWINYVHAKDAVRTAAGWQATFLGNGALPLKEICAALDATGRAVPFCLEFPGGEDPEEAVRQSLEFLRRLGYAKQGG